MCNLDDRPEDAFQLVAIEPHTVTAAVIDDNAGGPVAMAKLLAQHEFSATQAGDVGDWLIAKVRRDNAAAHFAKERVALILRHFAQAFKDAWCNPNSVALAALDDIAGAQVAVAQLLLATRTLAVRGESG